MKKPVYFIISLVILILLTFVCTKYYSFLFSRSVNGEVLRVERVNTVEAIIASKEVPIAQLFSFAISIKDKNGEIHTSSSEDRQWAVVSPGQCAQVKLFPYPPWEFSKGKTYFGARLEKLYECSQTR